MSTLGSVFKQEIQRVAKRVTKSATAGVRKNGAKHRRDIAELKRVVRELSRRMSYVEKQERRRGRAAPSAEAAEKTRFSPGWVKSQRRRLGLSAAKYAKLVGVTPLTIYNWEQGKSKPRRQQLAALASVRKLGKREALQRLEK